MNTLRFRLALLGLGCCTAATASRADTPNPSMGWFAGSALSLTAGTLGVGLELTVPIASDFNFRAGGQGFESGSKSVTPLQLTYQSRLKLASFPVLFDWYAGGSLFHLTAGGLIDLNRVDLGAQSGPNGFVINNDVYTSAQVNSINTTVDFNKVAPYFGVGYGSAIAQSGRWSFSIDAGFIWQGDPRLSYTTFGSAIQTSAFFTDINVDQNRVKRTYDRLEYYPVLQGSVSYRF